MIDPSRFLVYDNNNTNAYLGRCELLLILFICYMKAINGHKDLFNLSRPRSSKEEANV